MVRAPLPSSTAEGAGDGDLAEHAACSRSNCAWPSKPVTQLCQR
jgi:hypothetical protein